MTSFDAKTLWSNPDRTRFFLIPDDRQLPPGDFPLRTATGRRLKVEALSLAPFEISEQQAKQWSKDEFGKLLDNMRGAADRFVEKLRQETAKLNEVKKPDNADEPRDS